jgi:hypothetical protein
MNQTANNKVNDKELLKDRSSQAFGTINSLFIPELEKSK